MVTSGQPTVRAGSEPQKASTYSRTGSDSSFTFDEDLLDSLILRLSGKIGVHPVDLVSVRFGTPPWVADGENQARVLQETARALPSETLGQTLARLRFVSPSEASWLDRGLTVTPMQFDCEKLIPLDRGDLLGVEEPETMKPISSVQYVGRPSRIGNKWLSGELAAVPTISEEPTGEEAETESTRVAQAHRLLVTLLGTDTALPPAKLLAAAIDLSTALAKSPEVFQELAAKFDDNERSWPSPPPLRQG